MEILNKLKVLDAYPKINEDFYSRTLSGGIITLVSSIFMMLLFFNELRESTSLNATTRLQVPAFRVCSWGHHGCRLVFAPDHLE